MQYGHKDRTRKERAFRAVPVPGVARFMRVVNGAQEVMRYRPCVFCGKSTDDGIRVVYKKFRKQRLYKIQCITIKLCCQSKGEKQ
jgi:hypothetical protein